MALSAPDSPVLEKTRELCQSIVDHPDFAVLQDQINAFLADETTRSDYQSLVEKSETLQHKQRVGMAPTADEIADFEQHRDKVINNPVARGFLDAQQEMHSVREAVAKYVAKTFEIGRLPSEEDFSSCGAGCSCH